MKTSPLTFVGGLALTIGLASLALAVVLDVSGSVAGQAQVEPPVAENADPLADAINRLVINVLKDGTLKTEHGDPLSLEELEARSREMTERLKGTGRKARLHVRGDRRSNVEELKKVIGAAARGGIDEVIVAAYRQNRYQN